MADENLLNERGVRITKTKATLMGTTYPVNGITSVRLSVIAKSAVPILLLIGGIMLAAPGLLLMVNAMSGDPGAQAAADGGSFCALVGIVLAVGGLLGLLMTSTRYAVVIGTAGGDRRALVTTDRSFAERVRQALEDAVEQRG